MCYVMQFLDVSGYTKEMELVIWVRVHSGICHGCVYQHGTRGIMPRPSLCYLCRCGVDGVLTKGIHVTADACNRPG
jgi:hypothetical protein